MTVTATDLTREHYQRPEVREIITQYAMPGNGTWRALNGDFHRWYRYFDDGQARLLNVPEDYDHLTNEFRTLYQSLNVFVPTLISVSRPKNEITPEDPLGTPADTMSYTLGVDIDKEKGFDIDDADTQEAINAAGQFLVDYLKENGVHKSVWPLFSGGGIYVMIHHEICKPLRKPDAEPKPISPEDRASFFEELTDRYNDLIAHVSKEFFKVHPEYIGKVKFDALNNSKRIFKCILSIHKKKSYAVTPLNRDAIKIDTERAKIPLKDDMIAEAKEWYSSYDPEEQIPFLKLVDKFKKTEEEQRKKATRQFAEIWRSSEKIDQEHFPPCIKHIIETPNEGTGKTRFTAILATFLYQLGWDEEEAWMLVATISDRNGVGNIQHIFDSCFGRISCPSCKTIQNDAAGYPHLGLKDLGACKKDPKCNKWPGDYALNLQTAEKGPRPKTEGPTVVDAIRALDAVCDGAKSQDGTGFSKFDREANENLIEKAISKGSLSPKEEKKAYKFIEKYKKQLKGLGIEYDDIGHISSEVRDDEKESAATALVTLVTLSGAELWHTPKQDFYISFERDGHKEHHPLRSKAVKLWMGSLFFSDRKKTPGSQALQDALTILEGFALFDGSEHEAYVRVGPYEDRIYVDLGDHAWRAIEVTKDGWKVVDKTPVRFWRPKSMLPLPDPVNCGNWDDLRKLINAKADRNWILIVAWAMQAFWPKGPYAHLNFSGEQGTGKTLAQIIFKLLLDPSETPLRRPPRDERDLMIAAMNERMPSFDNLSGMPEYLSDAFCGLSTGVALATRALYTDGEEAIFAARRPCVMNGIDTLTNRGDLLDRTIVLDLPRIDKSNRRLEKRILRDFERIRPQMLGLFLDATSTGLKREAEIGDADLPRMADFCEWIKACEPALPWEPGEFMKEYLGAIDDALSTLVESDQVAKAVYELALEFGQINRPFSGTASELLDLLNKRKYIDSNHPPKGWPRTANTLSSRLRRVAPALRTMNVNVETSRSAQTKIIKVSMIRMGQKILNDDPMTISIMGSSSENRYASTNDDDHDDRDDKMPYSSVEKMKRKKEEKDDESGRVGNKIVMIDTSSPAHEMGSSQDRHGIVIGSSRVESEIAKGEQRAQDKEARYKEVAQKYSSNKKPDDILKVRFLKEYRTHVPRPGVPNAYDDKLYLIGEIADQQRWRVERLLEKGIVELMRVPGPEVPQYWPGEPDESAPWTSMDLSCTTIPTPV